MLSGKNEFHQNNRRLVLVTGGAGYKGSTLVRELLSLGYRVRVLDSLRYGGRSIVGVFNHPNFEFLKVDITSVKEVAKSFDGVTDVIHLAAIVGDKPCERDPKLSIEVNYKATQHLAEIAKKNKIGHFIFASTCSNYGIADTSFPAAEDRELNPVSLYSETKIDCEEFLTEFAKNGGFSPVMLRFSTGFGISGRTRFDLTVNSFTYEALRDKKLIVFAAKSWRPFAHVLDMARIYCAMLKIPRQLICGQIFNAGWNSQNYMKKDIIDMIKEVIGEFEVDYADMVEDKRSYLVDFTKIERFLKLQPTVSLKDGIAELVSAIRDGFLTDQDFENNRLK